MKATTTTPVWCHYCCRPIEGEPRRDPWPADVDRSGLVHVECARATIREVGERARLASCNLHAHLLKAAERAVVALVSADPIISADGARAVALLRDAVRRAKGETP